MVSGLQIGLWGCGFLVLTAGLAQAAPASKLPVAATIVPLGDFCRHLGGDLVEVQVLIPPGASPHVFEPSPSVMAKAAQVRVFVYIGAGMEPWAVKVLQARETGKVTVVEASRGLHLIREVGEPHPGETPGAKPHRPEGDGNKETHEHHKDHCHEAGNPHVWLDPVLAQDICRRIAAAFMEADPPNRDRYEANLKSYLAALEELHQEIQRQSAAFKIRDFISFHPSFTYFARRYGLREMGVMEEAPGREPTPRHLQGLVKTIRNSGLKAVFAEPQLNPRIAETLAREAGVQVLMLDPVGGRPPYGSDYLQMMRHNLAVLTAGMK
jgi:zinc transport system substrate-binding protein